MEREPIVHKIGESAYRTETPFERAAKNARVKREHSLQRDLEKFERVSTRQGVDKIREEFKAKGTPLTVEAATRIFMDRLDVKDAIDKAMPAAVRSLVNAPDNGGVLMNRGNGLWEWVPLPESSSGSEFPWDKLSFGYAISTTETSHVTIYGGTLFRHGHDALESWDVGDANIHIPSDGYTIWAMFDPAADDDAGELTIIGDADYPSPTADKAMIRLYKFHLVGTDVSLERIYHIGDIHVIPYLSP